VVAPGQVFVPAYFAEGNINGVTQDIVDPISREPNYKECAVRVEKYSTARHQAQAIDGIEFPNLAA
jgi:assimilatory nitrate reductase catalytic subunit